MLSGARAADIRSSSMEAPGHIEEFANGARKAVAQARHIIRGRDRPGFPAGPEKVGPGRVWKLSRKIDDRASPIEDQRKAVCEHHAYGNASRPFALVHVVDREPNVGDHLHG